MAPLAVEEATGDSLHMLFGGFQVVGNGFGFDSLSFDLPVPVTPVIKVDRGTLAQVTIIPAGPFGPTATSLQAYPTAPLLLYIRDAKRRFFLSVGKNASFACPDGHAFVGWYRRLTVASTFGVFKRVVQKRRLDEQDVDLPQKVIRTVNSAITFDRNDPYANYNWELFLHLPLAVADYLAGLTRAFSLRHEFASEWYRFVNPSQDAQGDVSMTLPLTKERFPSIFRNAKVGLAFQSLEVLVAVKPDYLEAHPADTSKVSPIKVSLKAGTVASKVAMDLSLWESVARFLWGRIEVGGEPGAWTLAGWLKEGPDASIHSRLDTGAIEDILLVCRYTCTLSS